MINANLQKRIALKTVEVAAGFIGTSRLTNPAQVRRFNALFGFDGVSVPFCATGLGYATVKAYMFLVDMDTGNQHERARALDILKAEEWPIGAYVPSIWAEAKRLGIDYATDILHRAATGSYAVFDWEGDGSPNHIGLVEHDDGQLVHTIEFNTTALLGASNHLQREGGQVARKVRPRNKTLLGFIRTY